MNPIIELSIEAVNALDSLKLKIEDWLQIYKLKDKGKQADLKEKKEIYLELLNVLKSTLSSVKAKGIEPAGSVKAKGVDGNPLEKYYEAAIELGVEMGTGASRKIAVSYQEAISNFLKAYDKASVVEQLEWTSAKLEIEESKKVLEDKIKRADEELARREKNIPSGGYFRFVEGEKENEKYYRLDWISRIPNIKGESYHVNNDTDNNLYHGGTNRYVIELYKASIDEIGKVTFIPNGTGYSLTKKGVELFNMLKNPYLSNEEVGNKPFPLLKDGEKSKNTQLKWSITLWAPAKKIAEKIELPDWNDYGFKTLLKEFKTKCAAKRLSEERASDLKEKMRVAIKKQKKLYATLNLIQDSLIADDNDKLIQQRDEISQLLKIWRKRIKSYAPLIEPLDYKDCLRPPENVEIEMGYWTGAVLNPKDAEKAIADAGVLDILRAYPSAVIQITATFDHLGSLDYIADPKSFMDDVYSAAAKKKYKIPSTIVQKRDFLIVKAQNVANLIAGLESIEPVQVQANITPGDTGEHMGNGSPFGNRVTLTWISDGK